MLRAGETFELISVSGFPGIGSAEIPLADVCLIAIEIVSPAYIADDL